MANENNNCPSDHCNSFGLVKKGTKNYIGKNPGNISITELQKTVKITLVVHLLCGKALYFNQSQRALNGKGFYN